MSLLNQWTFSFSFLLSLFLVWLFLDCQLYIVGNRGVPLWVPCLLMNLLRKYGMDHKGSRRTCEKFWHCSYVSVDCVDLYSQGIGFFGTSPIAFGCSDDSPLPDFPARSWSAIYRMRSDLIFWPPLVRTQLSRKRKHNVSAQTNPMCSKPDMAEVVQLIIRSKAS